LDRIQNGLYTASRTGNQGSLKDYLQELQEYVEKTGSDDTSSINGVVKNSLREEVTSEPICGADNSVMPEGATRTNGEESSVRQNGESLCNLEWSKFRENAHGASQFLALLNRTFGVKKETLLHVSSRMGKAEVITPLLEAGADPCVR
jgi:hypothetical protein